MIRAMVASLSAASGVKLLRTGEAVGYHYNEEGYLVLETAGISMDTAEYADCFAIEER